MPNFKRWILASWILLGALGHATAQSVWTVQDTSVQNSVQSLYSVIWTGSQLVAVGYPGTVLTSPDGVNWAAHSSGSAAYLQSVTWASSPTDSGTGQLVAVGNGTILTSPDGVTWTNRSAGISNNLNSVTWTGSQYVAVGDGILTSPDGINWTSRASGTSAYLESVVWTGASDSLDSTNGSGAELMAVGGNGTILTSPDGITWTIRTSGTLEYLYSMAWADSQYVVVGAGGTILTSPDGIRWTSQNSGTPYALSSVIWADSQWVAVGDVILASPDGVTWTPASLGAPNDLNSVTWTGSQYVAVGQGNTIVTSPQAPVAIVSRLRLQNANALSLKWAPSLLTATLPNSMSGQNVFAAIYSFSGKKMVESHSSSGGACLLPIQTLGRGSYLLEVTGSSIRVVQPIHISQ